MLLVSGWLRWPGDCSLSRLMALLLGRLLGVLLFTEARTMGRAVQWGPMKPESWSRWFPLPFADLLLLLVTLRLTERATRAAGTVRVNWSEASSLQADWTELRRLLNWLEADPSENTARNNTCCVCWLPLKSCLSGCYLDTDLRKRCLVIEIPNTWEVSMGGSHTSHEARLLAGCAHLPSEDASACGRFEANLVLSTPELVSRLSAACTSSSIKRHSERNWSQLWL
jgi:hypothetical protein